MNYCLLCKKNKIAEVIFSMSILLVIISLLRAGFTSKSKHRVLDL